MRKYTLNYQINYDTQWIHDSLGPEYALYFEPNTPIEHIVNQAESLINQTFENTTVNYKNSLARFKSLYRNTLPKVLGWQVFYKKPKSKQKYGPIAEKIGYVAREAQSLRNTHNSSRYQLKRPMLWKHKLYPVISSIEIKGPIFEYSEIVDRLKQEVSKNYHQQWISNWSRNINALNDHYEKLQQKCSLKLDNQFLKQELQSFSQELNSLNNKYKQLNQAQQSLEVDKVDIYDVLRHKIKTAKGWSVEFLDITNEN